MDRLFESLRQCPTWFHQLVVESSEITETVGEVCKTTHWILSSKIRNDKPQRSQGSKLVPTDKIRSAARGQLQPITVLYCNGAHQSFNQ